MKLIVQRTDTTLVLGGKLSMEEQFDTLADEGATIYEMASQILARFPRFKEVIISTEISNEQTDNQEGEI